MKNIINLIKREITIKVKRKNLKYLNITMKYFVLTKKVTDLRKNDSCIIKDKIYNIKSIWIDPILTSNGLDYSLRFILMNENENYFIEKKYPLHHKLETDENKNVIMD